MKQFRLRSPNGGTEIVVGDDRSGYLIGRGWTVAGEPPPPAPAAAPEPAPEGDAVPQPAEE